MPRIELSELVRYNPGLWSCPPEGDQLPPEVEDPGPWSHPLAGYQLPPKLSDSPVSPAPNSLVFLQPNVCPYTMMAALVRGRANMSPIELTEIVKSTPELSYDPSVDMVPRGGRGDPWSHFQAKNGWNEKFIEEVAVSSRPSGESSRVVDDSSYSMLHSREGPKYGMPFGWFYGGRVKMFGSL